MAEMKKTQEEETVANRIRELEAEIEKYRQAAEDAMGALNSAEQELNEVLAGYVADHPDFLGEPEFP